MFGLRKSQGGDLLLSKLLDQASFYNTFEKDLTYAKHQVILESPFISFRRLNYLLPVLHKLIRQGVQVIVNTKPAEEQDADYVQQAIECIEVLQEISVDVFVTGGYRRRLAIIDRKILYEGSLNILSQNDGCEVMRRIYSEQLAVQMINFIKLAKYI